MGEFKRVYSLRDLTLAADVESQILVELGPDWRNVNLEGEAWVYIDLNVVRGVAGLEPIWPGRHVLWSYVGALGLGDWKRILRFTRLRVERALARDEVNRVEATAAITDPKYCRFLERLGFHSEGRLAAYSPLGGTVEMFSRVSP